MLSSVGDIPSVFLGGSDQMQLESVTQRDAWLRSPLALSCVHVK